MQAWKYIEIIDMDKLHNAHNICSEHDALITSKWTSLFEPRPEKIWTRGNQTFFVLHSTEHEIYPAHKG